MRNKRVAILGTAGVPANYGGFETLAENLVKYHNAMSLQDSMVVYCSSKSYSCAPSDSFRSAEVRPAQCEWRAEYPLRYPFIGFRGLES